MMAGSRIQEFKTPRDNHLQVEIADSKLSAAYVVNHYGQRRLLPEQVLAWCKNYYTARDVSDKLAVDAEQFYRDNLELPVAKYGTLEALPAGYAPLREKYQSLVGLRENMDHIRDSNLARVIAAADATISGHEGKLRQALAEPSGDIAPRTNPSAGANDFGTA